MSVKVLKQVLRNVVTLCPTKAKIVQTNINFGRKMSDVQPLFQVLYTYMYTCIIFTIALSFVTK